MELSEALRRRSMCRNFSPSQVERDKLEELVYAAGRAPQGGNMPVREYIMVDDPKYVKLLRGVTPSFLANAPAALVICTDLSKALDVMGVQGRDVLSLLDAGAAAENVALKAVELGLGVSFVRSATTEAAKKVLGIPERYRVDIIVGIGYKSKDRPPPMKGSKPTVHHDAFGMKWYGQA
jgi:nitroreductase